MVKLYPPIIDGTLPAFYGNLLTVPFQMNRAVSKSEVISFQIKIKTVQNSRYVYSNESGSDVIIDWDNNLVSFKINAKDIFRVGQYYKVQIAYVTEGNVVGYFSSSGVTKYTTEPKVYIENLKTDKNNLHLHSYTGVYSQKDRDTTEKLYSYKFNLYDSKYQLILSSGEQLHNSMEDVENYESINNYIIERDLDQEKKYYIRYEIVTTNGLEYASPYYTIVQKIPIEPEFNFDICAAEPDREDGCIKVHLSNIVDTMTGLFKTSRGTFKLLRADSKTNFTEWYDIMDFAFYDEQPGGLLYTDYTIEHGVEYQYASIQYSKFNIWSKRLESNKVRADFEYAYLFDGKRQLKIKYNPKISSFKAVHLETKLDTIGSKHPYIFRNGNVDYKEFPISGLISLQSDENSLFLENEFFEKAERKPGAARSFKDYSTYSIDNIQAERDFKLEVLSWLNNGQPKLFRSSTEGNYIVRLLNVSLSPMDQLGRLLHTFNSTAYEIADNNFATLKSLGFINENKVANKVVGWSTTEVSKALAHENLISYKAISLRLEDFMPGDQIYINDGVKRQTSDGTVQIGQVITIGTTGIYEIDLKESIEISEVKLVYSVYGSDSKGLVTYAYYKTANSSFDYIKEMEVVDVPIQQFSGESRLENESFFNKLSNVKQQIQKIYFLRASYIGSDRLKDTGWMTIDGNDISIKETNYIYVKDFDINSIITFDQDVMVEICYQLSKVTYEIEDTNREIRQLKQKYETSQSEEDYEVFISALTEELERLGAIKGEVV